MGKFKVKNLKFKNFFYIAAIMLLFLFLIAHQKVQAQPAPVFMVTWQAESFIPAEFEGRAIPTNRTSVEVAMNLVENKKIVNLSGTEIKWFVNDKRVLRGNGAQLMHFQVDEFTNRAQGVRIEIPDHKGIKLEKTILIPLATPELVVQTFRIGDKIGAGETITLKAMPYFFNTATIQDLSFNWLVNNKEPRIDDPLAFTSPNELALTIPKEVPSETLVNIIASAKNIRIPSEMTTVLKKTTVF